jgi:Fe-S oxidoreductase
VTTFKDELLNLFPDDPDARKLSGQVVLFSDFLVNHAHWQPQRINAKALVHGHCHQKAVLGMTTDLQLLKLLGIDATMPDTGCCGMSGSFGFKPQHYETSVQAASLELLPALAKTEPDTLVIANGYSCREQIEQLTGRRTLHIAEAARMGVAKQ